MPLLSNKVYVLNKTKKDKKEEDTVLFHPLTNEICENAEELERKVFLYNQKIWTCKITGQVNLTFKEALKSEQGCAKKLKNSFMKCYESTVLQYVHHSRENLDNIIHKAWTQIHEEYCVNEPVMIKLTAPKQLHLKGIVVKIDRSFVKPDKDVEVSPSKITSDASSSDKENIKKKIIPIKKNFHYSVKLFEMDKLVNDIPAETIERTLRPPSKDQIRIFIRAHAFRHSGKLTNPWIVNEDLVKKYKLPNTEPEFICDKIKMREISKSTELQMYTKLMEDVEKKNGDISISDGDDSNKKPRKSAEGSASKKMKQMTLLDMRNDTPKAARTPTKVKTPFISPSRSIPPLAQQLLRLIKDNKNDHMVNQLMLKCCQYTDTQIAKLPELIRGPIKEKKSKLELKKKLKNMSQAEKDVFMAERRVELRHLQREKKKVEVKIDDADMVHARKLALGSPLTVTGDMTHDQWARIMSLSEFVRCFKGLLGPASVMGTGDLMARDFCHAVIGKTDNDQALLADIVCLFLKPLLQDEKIRQRKEMGVSLGEMPVTACTAGELLRLVLPMTATEDENNDEENDETIDGEIFARVASANCLSSSHNNEIAGPICERLAHSEMQCLTVEEKIAVLELLQGRILELDIISGFIDEYQREATEAYKRRQTEMKELNDKLKEVRASMTEMSKVISSETVVRPGEDGSERTGEEMLSEDMPQSARRRLSLEMRSKEQEEREHRIEMERQYQRLERDEANYKKMIDALNTGYQTAINEAKQLMRVQPLGTDRTYRRYWMFRSAPGAIYVEEEKEDRECGGVTTVWRVHRSLEEVALLMASLDERGLREHALKKEIQAAMPTLMAGDSPRDEEVNGSTDIESFLVRGFKEELRETELNIRQGSLGGVPDYQHWDQQLASAGDFVRLKEALRSVFLGVHDRFWNAPMKSASGRSEFVTAVDEARTQSRLNILQCLLDVCVCWSKSASDDKCRVCHKGHHEHSMLLCDGCNRAYHIFCLRPPLKKVPEGEWLCPRCKPVDEKPVATKAASVTTDAQSVDEAVVAELCCVCKTGGDESLGKCVHCGDLYHAECHEPPLRHMRRTGWYCSSCRREEVAVVAGNNGQRVGRASKTRVDGADEMTEEGDVANTRRSNGSTKRKMADGEDEEDEQVATVARKGHGRVKKKRMAVNEVYEEYDDDEEDEDESHKRRASRTAVSSRRSNGRVKRKLVEEDYEEEEVEEETKRPVKRSRRSAKSEDNGTESDQDVSDLRSLVTVNNGSSATRTTGRHRDKDQTNKTIRTLIRQMAAHKSAWPFRDPVDEQEVPDYYSIISTPVDLSLMMERHRNDVYAGGSTGLRKFLGDVRQMFTNADLYNEPDSDIVSLAVDLEDYFISTYDKCDLGLRYERRLRKEVD